MEFKKGVNVISDDGAKIGVLDRVITDSNNDIVTHLVISSGLFIKKRKMIPVYWLGDIADDQLHLSVRACLFDCLLEFRPKSD
ncbi:MAG TPA: PRC-barrel domain-containing protein [Anaerolineales bacterium]|nr:PRC-barrel domain-containing protein [Anaerolineales bacterium]